MKAVSSMATRRVLADLNEAASAAGLPALDIESVGGVDAARRVADGEPFDLVFLALDALQRLAADGHVEAESVTPLMLSQVAVGVPSGSDAPAVHDGGFAFPNASGMQAALRGAARIGYSTGPSGTALVSMIDDWGSRTSWGAAGAGPSGHPVARSLAEGEVDLGFQQLSELVGQPGVRILGVLPPDCAIDTVFAGAVATASSDPAAARETLAFLASDAAAPVKAAHSFTPAR
ncbi:MAG: ABC transporter substrate-binding protein [Candidatus Leucobacter sulfamidivorax]|nr:ABC transporter substrate-binding protein [Candidatus Leucobacter sulfamidivorax]